MSTFIRHEILITGKYKMQKKIGGGSFGDIYLAINIDSGEVKMLSIYSISNFKPLNDPLRVFAAFSSWTCGEMWILVTWRMYDPSSYTIQRYLQGRRWLHDKIITGSCFLSVWHFCLRGLACTNFFDWLCFDLLTCMGFIEVELSILIQFYYNFSSII